MGMGDGLEKKKPYPALRFLRSFLVESSIHTLKSLACTREAATHSGERVLGHFSNLFI